MIGIGSVTLAHTVGWNELGICVDGDGRPEVSDSVLILSGRYVALLLTDVAPDLIDLDTLASKVVHHRVKDIVAGLSDPHHEAHDGVTMDTRHLLHGPDTVSFD